MTMRVYTVDRYGFVSGPVTVTVEPRGPLSLPLPSTHAWPPCGCVRCADRLSRGGRRNDLGVVVTEP
ncbi:hypothetical protein [Wenjunlia tyrosinilytica]|nr:hypothetical protein [Wenjunlia tyrosinilytica]